MGIIKEQYEKYGSEFLSNFLIGSIKSVLESEFKDNNEKVKEIESLIEEYHDLKMYSKKYIDD